MENDEEILKQAAAIMRSRRDPQKLRDHARAVAESRRGSTWTEEQKAKLREAQAARRERERAEREAAGLVAVASPTEKRRPGRPKKETTPTEATPKRPVGRPRKQDSQTAIEIDANAGKGV